MLHLALCQTTSASDKHRAKTLQVERNFFLPDVDAAEHPEHHPEDESHRHGQQCGQHAVKDEFDQLKGGVASDPHSIEAVRGDGLRDDIFKTDLSDHIKARTHNELEK